MKTVINDTADVILKRKRDGHLVATAEAQIAGFSQAVTQDKLKGGIGNRTIAILRSDKEITLNLKNALFDLEWLAMSQGVEIEKGTFNVYKTDYDLIVSDIGEVDVTREPIGLVTLQDTKGNSITLEAKDKTVTVPEEFAKSGDELLAIYKEEVKGRSMEIASDKFSEKYEIEYRTIEYDPDTNQVINYLYFQFDNVTPSGEFDMSLENGTALTPELKFEATAKRGSGKMGRVLQIPVDEDRNPIDDTQPSPEPEQPEPAPDPGSDTGTQTKSVDVGDSNNS